MNTKENQWKRILLIIGIVICLIVIIIFGFIGIRKLMNDATSRDEYELIKEEALDNAIEVNTERDEHDIPFYVNFNYLKGINPDVVGWLYVPSLDISYPIMQGKTNETYLHHTMKKDYLYAGSIFLDMDNAKDFSDPNSLVYGHNMRDGSMFGTLWHIPYQHAADDNPYFWVFTPKEIYRYKIFAAYDTRADKKTYHLFLKGNMEFRNWCLEMQSWSYIDFGYQRFTAQSKVITLSTCSGTSTIDRTVVQGVQSDVYRGHQGSGERADDTPETGLNNGELLSKRTVTQNNALYIIAIIGIVILLVSGIVYVSKRKRS